MANSCPQQQLLEEFSSGRMDATAEETVAVHVAECRTCQSRLDAVTALPIWPRQNSDDPQSGWSGDLAQRITSRVQDSVSDSTPCTSSLPPEIPGCEIRGVIGRGGMGDVYLAWQQRLERNVAVKVLPPALSADSQYRSRFLREIAAVGQLNHPGIVTAFDANEHNGLHYLVMEYVEGRNLSATVRQLGPLRVADAVEVIRQTAEALQYVHDSGLLHRDVKPSNLMLTPDGAVTLLDLGLARFGMDRAARGEELTSTSQVLGTLEYMPPEQAHGGSEVDARADVFSLGATFFKLLTGVPPVKAGQATERPGSLPTVQRPSIAELRSDLPNDLVEIIDRMLEPVPEDRFGSMREVLAELERVPCGEPRLARLLATESGQDLNAEKLRAPNGKAIANRALPQGKAVLSSSEKQGSSRSAGQSLGWLIAAAVILAAITIIIRTPDGGEVRIDVEDGSAIRVVDDGAAANSDGDAFADFDSGDQFFQAGPQDVVLPGLVSAPVPVSGVRRWQIDTRRLRGNMQASLDWHPNGKLIACGLEYGAIHLFDSESLELTHCLAGHTGGVNRVAWSPDGTLLAAAGGDGTVRLWSVDGHQGPVFNGHRSFVTSVAWSPDGSTLASTGGDGAVRLWRPDGSCGPVLRGHSGQVNAVAWNFDGTRLVSGGEDGQILFWNSDGTPTRVAHPADTAKPVNRLVWNPRNNQILVVRKFQSRVEITDGNRNEDRFFDEHGAAASDVAWNPGGQLVASGGTDGTLRIWDAEGASSKAVAHPGYVRAVAWSPDGQRVVSIDSTGILCCWNFLGEKLLERTSLSDSRPVVAWSPDGETLACGHQNPSVIRLWNSDGTLRQTLSGHSRRISALSWSPDGKRLASGSYDKTIRLWASDGTPAGVLEDHKNMVMTLAWSPDNSRLASAGSDRKIRVWRNDGTIERVLSGDSDRTTSVTWSADSTRLFATGRSGYVQSWSVKDDGERNLLATLEAGDVLARQPNGEWLAVGGVGHVLLVDADGHPGRQFNTDCFRAPALAWSPDGQAVVVGDESIWRASRVQMWSVDGVAGPIVNHSGSSVSSVVWSRAGNMVAISDQDGTVHVWNPATSQTRWKSLLIGDDDPLTFAPDGTLLDGDQNALDEHCVYIVEMSDGQLRTLTPPEFRKLAKR